jgi:hypothetical protein
LAFDYDLFASRSIVRKNEMMYFCIPMKIRGTGVHLYLCAAALLCAGTIARAEVPAWARNWLPITDADRNLKAPQVDKNAGVEAIFWRSMSMTACAVRISSASSIIMSG